MMITTVIDTTVSSCEIKLEKNLGLNGTQTHELYNAGAVLHQLSYQNKTIYCFGFVVNMYMQHLAGGSWM